MHKEHKASYHPIRLSTPAAGALKAGNDVTIGGNFFMAPLAGYTDSAFRSVMRMRGADYCYTEMVSAEALARGNEASINMLKRGIGERALATIMKAKPTTIDINVGCPVPKVVHTGAGSALLKSPERVEEIVRTLVAGSGVPVSVKFRLGWDSTSINYLEVADAALGAGASLLCLHGRTKKSGYSGTADWDACRELVDYVRSYEQRKQAHSVHSADSVHSAVSQVPVFVSGDLFDPEAIVRMLETTGADGALIARGAMGNPWIFERTRALLETGELPPPPSPLACGQMALVQLALTVLEKGEHAASREMRKQVPSYFSGFAGASAMRRKIVQANTVAEYKTILEEMLGNLGSIDEMDMDLALKAQIAEVL